MSMKPPRIVAVLLCLLAFVVLPGRSAAAADDTSPWRVVKRQGPLPAADPERVLAPGAVRRVVTLSRDALKAILDRAPREQDVKPVGEVPEVVLSLPVPDGRLARFRVEESPIMEPELAAQFPEIRTYRGHGIDDPTATVRFDWTRSGFHAMVLSAGGTVFIDPWSRRSTLHYVAYYKKDYRRRTPVDFRCETTGAPVEGDTLGPELRSELGIPTPQVPFGTVRRTYRLALAATGEYTAEFGGVGGAAAEITTAMNRVNAIYERELGIHMNLIGNETSIIYTNPGGDPYTNNNGVTMLGENQANLDSVIGDTNYDIGHVFSTGGGGVAALGVVCTFGDKAKGVTGLPNPTGDTFYVDYVAHEMGHQFGANHTFNGTNGFCGSAGQRIASKAYEPGSASTIMGYAGICGSQNIQPNSDDYFHGASLDEMRLYANGAGSCATTSGSNVPPTVTVGGPYTIPKQTPFRLAVASSSTGGDPGDALTYVWEQFDANLTDSPPDNDVSAQRPIFRSFPPSTSPSRTFPKLASILTPPANCEPSFECLPTRAWTGGTQMHFRVTVRDNHDDGGVGTIGGTDSALVTVNVIDTAGPFKVTAPNTAIVWGLGTSPSVTWAVANTHNAPVSCANVDILLSTDGGNTFPTVPSADVRILAAATPNDGTQVITVPNVATTSTARVKVQCSDATRPFFDISDANFTIAPTATLVTADQVVAEGNAGTTPVNFTVNLGAASASPVTVNWAVANGITSAADFSGATTGVLSFSPGDTTKTFIVNVKGETTFETSETFNVNITSSNAQIGDGQALVTITNDDAPPTASINDVSVFEGNSGLRNLTFTASLSAVSGVATSVTYATADGTATLANNDYKAISGSLSFAPGTTTRTLAVQIVGDTVFEGDETFNVNIAAGDANVTIADAQGVGTILDDDSAGKFAFGGATFTVSEAASVATIKVIRTAGLAGGSGVTYAVSDGTATAPADYGPTSGTLTFNAYQSVATFTLPIVKDTIDEPNEVALLRLSAPFGPNAQLGTQPTAALTITDNDSSGKFIFGAATYTVNEAAAATITVRRTGGTAGPVTDDYAIGGGTAVAGTDYTFISGTLTFGVGQVTQTFQVQTLAIAGPQGNKTANLALSNPMGGAVLGTPSNSVLTIVDDQPSAQFSAATFTAAEAGTKATITVKRTGPPTTTVFVDYATSAGGTATDGSDYTATTGTLTFLSGQLLKTFTIPLLPDTTTEGDETVTLQLTANVGSPTPVGIGTAPGASATGAATLVIKDNDPQQRLQFTLATYTASEAAPKAVISVKRTGSNAGTVFVDYDVTGGSATGGGTDYSFTSGTLTFGPGQATRTFAITLVNDALDEGTETVNLALNNAQGGALLGTPAAVVLNITDNEPVVQFTTARYTASETATKATITVRRVGSTAGTVFVDYQTSDGTATDTLDYTGTSGTLTFGPGVATRTFVITLLPDTADEANETLNLTLQNASGIALGTPSTAVLTIADNDIAGKSQFQAATFSVLEGVAGGLATITVTRSGGTAGPATVDWATSDGVGPNGALAGVDYTAATGSVTFGVGEKSKTFPVAITDRVGPQSPPNRYLNVTLSTPSGILLGVPSTATLWIVDDD